MIVCHCNRISHSDIEDGVDRLLDRDPLRLLTPVLVYRTFGKRPRCGACLPLAANLVQARAECRACCCHACPLAQGADEARAPAAAAAAPAGGFDSGVEVAPLGAAAAQNR